MGQTLSHDGQRTRTREELRRELANKFASKCFTSLELYSLKDVFKSLADVQQNALYLKEDTLARFLEVPDVLQVSPVLFQMVSFLGAFPFLSDAPIVLGLEELIIVVTLLTERYKRVLSKGASDRSKLLFKSLAIYDRKASEMDKTKEEKAQVAHSSSGFEVDKAGEDEPEEELDDEDDDDLVISAFDALDCTDAFMLGSHQTIHGAMIPADNFRGLITLLLLVAPLGPQERLSQYPVDIQSLRACADSILAAFLNVEQSPGIKYRSFSRVLDSLPYMFDAGFNALFEHFLFSRNLDLGKKTTSNGATVPTAPVAPVLAETGSILNHAVLSQLSFFLPGSDLFRRLRPLYSGEKDGFSMGAFEAGVFNWRAPTLLLVRGTRIVSSHSGSADRFTASLPPKRFPDGSPTSPAASSTSQRLMFGLYLSQPWRHTHKDCLGGADTLLFQLSPVHDVFRASTLNTDYISFPKPAPGTSSAAIGGVAAGNPPPSTTRGSSSSSSSSISLGPVSLLLDTNFEFGVFTHDYTSHGGAFQRSAIRRFDFQDRFEIEELEVWGCGGDAEAKTQAERWAWEAREAEARRRINLGTGDLEADRALLEMAGLVGANRSGGSMA